MAKNKKLPRPIVGVCIPSYNYADKVERAIRSVMAQTLTNLRCVIVDDGSTDNTGEIVRAAIANDRRFSYIRQDNAGVANARNRGVFSDEMANSKYVCCLDADDALAPTFLQVCVNALEHDRTISIVYTGLYYYTPDGEEGLSSWPGKFDFNAQLEGRNQIPTCNVSRRVIWERLGGQRQRYAPEGAGEEDAEMWLRAGAYGFMAKKITNEGLFLYSWKSGRVSGNKQHKITDYRGWHPWTKDKKFPFACVAPAERLSHPVRQYDEPKISVIIPVGKGHEKTVISALDSLDAQTFRKWEAVVCWDSADTSEIPFIKRTFPHIRLIRNSLKSDNGAGYARNRAVEVSRAPLLVFLDADDWLMPPALQMMYEKWKETETITYTDYVGLATIDDKLARNLNSGQRLLEYNPKTGDAVISHQALEYDCNRAIQQPNPVDMYIWGLVTMLVPRAWHDEIGGFDETMPSWEDWDYQIRLACAGKCFTRIPAFGVVYRFYTGNRRETGLKEYPNLVEYMRGKQSRRDAMCGCRGATAPNFARNPQPMSSSRSVPPMSDDEFVMIRYAHPNIGQHMVVGPVTGRRYGYRGGGEIFLVHRDDIPLYKDYFVPIPVEKPETPVSVVQAAPPPPVKLEARIDVQEEVVPAPRPRRRTTKKAA